MPWRCTPMHLHEDKNQQDTLRMTTATPTQKAWQLTMQVAIGFFFLAAILGTLMRYMYLQEITFLDYKHVLHAHSHIAMLGWGFTALAGALVFIFLPNAISASVYRKVFWGNLIAGLGMFVTFLYQGYGVFSISFSTLHVLIAYYFAWHFLQGLNKQLKTSGARFARWAVYWMLVSTLGLWLIAPVSILLGKLHPLYFASIQFFLHFQFNGWFMFGVLALLFRHSENNASSVQLSKGVFGLLQLSLLLTYTLSITWSTPEDFLFYLNSLGVILQILAFVMLANGFYKSAVFSFQPGSLSDWLLRLGLLSIALKVIVQGLVAIPFIAEVSYTIRNFVIGFIHLTMLGAFSVSLLGILMHRGDLPAGRMAFIGYRLLFTGFILTEALLFLQGILLWLEMGFITNYHTIIFGATALLPVSILFIFIASFRRGGV